MDQISQLINKPVMDSTILSHSNNSITILAYTPFGKTEIRATFNKKWDIKLKTNSGFMSFDFGTYEAKDLRQTLEELEDRLKHLFFEKYSHYPRYGKNYKAPKPPTRFESHNGRSERMAGGDQNSEMESINELIASYVEMGYSQSDVIQALKKSGGDMNRFESILQSL